MPFEKGQSSRRAVPKSFKQQKAAEKFQKAGADSRRGRGNAREQWKEHISKGKQNPFEAARGEEGAERDPQSIATFKPSGTIVKYAAVKNFKPEVMSKLKNQLAFYSSSGQLEKGKKWPSSAHFINAVNWVKASAAIQSGDKKLMGEVIQSFSKWLQ